MDHDPYEGTTNMEGAAKYLKRNYWTFRTSYKHYQVPCEQIGGRLCFRFAHLDAWNKANPNLMRLQREAA